MVFIIEISPSVADKVRQSFFDESLTHSKTGTVVFEEQAFTTLSTASDKSIPSQTHFIVNLRYFIFYLLIILIKIYLVIIIVGAGEM